MVCKQHLRNFKKLPSLTASFLSDNHTGKKKFSFCGCGWKSVNVSTWTKEKQEWILTIDKLFSDIFGNDYLSYQYDKDKGTSVDGHTVSQLLEYDHEAWEKSYLEGRNVEEDFDPCHSGNQNGCPKNKNAIVMHAPKQHCSSKKLAFDGTQSTNAPVLTLSNKPSSNVVSPVPNPPAAVVVIPDEECEEQMQTSSHADASSYQGSQLSSAMSTATTRADLAALDTLIPPVEAIHSTVVSLQAEVTFDCTIYSNPYCLIQRPCEASVKTAEKILSDEKKTGRNPSGVRIKDIGHFSEQGLSVLNKFSVISETKRKVDSEAKWLPQITSSPGELAILQDVLWNKPSSSPVLHCNQKALDVISFSDLCEERYIDSFVVDVCIGKYIEEAALTHGQDDTLYLPTEFYQWMEMDDKAFKLRQLAAKASQIARFQYLKQILVPVFMGNHWGLVYADLVNQQLYFDDGLASVVPSTTLPCVKEALDLLLELYPYHPCLQSKFWHSCKSFSRFGMPSQVPTDRKMIGVGSCGIGIIMAARDFIMNGAASVNNILWRYCNMDKYRKELMVQILKWAGHEI